MIFTSIDNYSTLSIKKTLVHCPPIFPRFGGVPQNKRREVLQQIQNYKESLSGLMAKQNAKGLQELIEQNKELFITHYDKISHLTDKELEYILT